MTPAVMGGTKMVMTMATPTMLEIPMKMTLSTVANVATPEATVRVVRPQIPV
jgi:hypothetical protein